MSVTITPNSGANKRTVINEFGDSSTENVLYNPNGVEIYFGFDGGYGYGYENGTAFGAIENSGGVHNINLSRPLREGEQVKFHWKNGYNLVFKCVNGITKAYKQCHGSYSESGNTKHEYELVTGEFILEESIGRCEIIRHQFGKAASLLNNLSYFERTGDGTQSNPYVYTKVQNALQEQVSRYFYEKENVTAHLILYKEFNHATGQISYKIEKADGCDCVNNIDVTITNTEKIYVNGFLARTKVSATILIDYISADNSGVLFEDDILKKKWDYIETKSMKEID